MRQIVTGIQTTGSPHLGNIVGAVRPAIVAGEKSELPPIYIVADMHSMLSVRDRDQRRDSTLRVAAVWMAFGADDIGLMYRQSRIPHLSEIALLLSGTASMVSVMEGPMKDDVFSNMHPVLMSADLLMLNTSHIPVGQDSIPHIEMVRDTAQRFNDAYGNVLVVPEGLIDENRPTVPGTDGRKMSKSFNNIIDVMEDPDRIRDVVRSISESITIDREGPYPQNLNPVAGIIKAIDPNLLPADPNLSIPRSKRLLEEYLIEGFQDQRKMYNLLLRDPDHISGRLMHGEARVLGLAESQLARMRDAMGMT